MHAVNLEVWLHSRVSSNYCVWVPKEFISNSFTWNHTHFLHYNPLPCRHVADYMNEKITHVLTQESWDDNFDQVKLLYCILFCF